MRVAMAALAEARSATAADRYADAHRALQLARALAVPRTQADTVDTRLRQREAAHAGIERLLRQAAAARAAHRRGIAAVRARAGAAAGPRRRAGGA